MRMPQELISAKRDDHALELQEALVFLAGHQRAVQALRDVVAACRVGDAAVAARLMVRVRV